MAENQDDVTLSWKQLYVDLDVTDSFPTQKFAEYLKMVLARGSMVTALDFSGIQQLTDDVFIMLKKVTVKTKLRESVRVVNCTGCVQLTDLGLNFLAQAFPALQEVYIAGCHQITGLTLVYLQRFCTQLTTVDMTATSATWIPAVGDNVSLSLTGCPRLPIVSMSTASESATVQQDPYIFHNKLIVMLYTGCDFNVIDFLSQSNARTSNKKETKEPKPQRFAYQSGVKLAGIEGPVNVFKCYGNYSLLSLSFTPESIFVIVIDALMDNAQLHIMNRITAIRSSAVYSGVVILGLHDAETKEEASAQFPALAESIDGYMKQQAAVLESHLQHDAFDSDLARNRDFSAQKRYCRSLRTSQSICQLYFFTLDRDSGHVSLKWPTPNSSVEKTNEDQGDDGELDPLAAARNKWLSDLESAKVRVSRLNKLDLSELRSISEPPAVALRTMDAMCYFLTNSTEANYKTVGAKYSLLTEIVNFNLDSISNNVISVVETFIDELLLDESRETINKMQPIFSVIHAWVCAVYGYATNCLQYERAAMERKLQEQQRQQEEIERELHSVGPSAILRVFRTILADVYDQKYFNRRARSNYSHLLRLVEKSLTDLKKQKILSLSHLKEKLASMWAERNEPVLSEPQLATILHWLNVQGKVLPVRNVPNKPVVFDIPWFVNILAELREEKSSCYQLNGSQCLCLSPQLPLITGKSLASFCETSEPYQFETLMSVLTCRGILVEVPSDTVQKATDPQDAVYFTFLLSAEKPFLRSGLVEGVESFSQFKDNYWPSAGKGSWLESDIKVAYYYNFITGFPVNMVARIIAEWSQLGKIVLVWRSGALVRAGAVEILLRHDVHGTLLSNGLAVEALLTTGWTRDMTDHAVLHEYLSGAISKYLLVIEYIVSQYTELGVTVSMSCQGSCLLRGLPGLIPVSELPRQVGFQVKCADCTDEGVNAERCVYYTGRQRFLPFHDWVSGGFSDMNNRISPYGKYYCGDSSSDADSTLCLFCGCSVKGSLRLWSMESHLHPSFIANSANFVEIKSSTNHQDLFELHGNVLNVYPCSSKSEKRKSPRALLTFSEPIYINGFTQLHVTVLKAGSAQLMFGQDFVSKISPTKLDTSHAFVTYDLQSGEIIPRDVLNKDLPLLPSVKGEPIDVGDKLTVNIIGNKVVTYTDKKLPDLKQSRMVVEFTLKKNGQKFYSGCVRFRSTIGLLVKASSNDEAMQLVLDAPDHPTVRACNFPLGSSLFYRNSVNSPWSFGYISSTMNGELTVSYPDDTNMVTVKPNSPDIAPVGHYSDGVNVIVIGKDETLSSSQLAQFIRTTKMSPAPIALLRGAQSRLLERYESLGLKMHETKYCSAYNLWPEVVEQAYARFKLTRGKNQKQRAEVPFLLLPANISLETVLNPVRQTAQDWSKQQLYFICKGFEWNLKNSSQRDAHFLDTKPVDLTTEEVNVIFQDALPAVILAYYSMEFRQNILPMNLKTFPAIEESLDTSLLIKPLSDLMLHYRSTLLLMQAMITIRGRTNKKLKTTSNALLLKLLKDNELTNLYTSNVTKDSAADAMSSGVASSSSGLCATHGFVAKKSGISTLINAQSLATLALTAVESFAILRYASCVLHIEIANVQFDAIQFKRLLQSFRFLEGINLTGSDVSSLSGISSCAQLRHLIVHGHQFSDLPSEMSVLVNLETLDITDGPLRSIPDFVCNYRNLRLLSVANTLVSQLPADIGQLSRLRTLNLSRCPMRLLPESVRNLRNLEVLRIQGIPLIGNVKVGSQFTRLQFEISLKSCTALSMLSEKDVDLIWNRCATPDEDSLNVNQRRDLNDILLHWFPRFGDRESANVEHGGMPPQIFALYKLRTLIVTNQAIRSVPREIGWLPRLSKLIINNNPYLEEVSGDVGMCALKVLDLSNCPMLKTPPKEIRDQGMSTVIAYLKRLLQGSRAVFQTKLMVVGLGGVGKTSLVRAMMSADNRAPAAEGEGITNGIDISSWSINQNGQTLTFSVWDFAGQTVYYNTHQLFLSRRGVYILTWNTRLGYEHAGLDFWLSSIACRCPGVPVFIVGTHADQITNPELPAEQLKKRFPNITGFHTVSSLTGQGIRELMETLIDVTMNLPYTGELVPEAWLGLEKALLSKRNVCSWLEWKEITTIAQAAGIYGLEVDQAVSFLHDLGTLQRFDHELLRDRVVINPQWIVDAMACVVSVQNTSIKNGRLKHKDIGTVWKKYPKELHRWLLKLTEVFELTFSLPNEQENVIPCLLSPNESSIDWPAPGTDGLLQTKAVYKFDYLPAGLFNRAQVRLYELSESATMWKAGSLLYKNGHMALFKQISDAQIQVQVHGPRPDNILLIIHEVIEGLVSDFFTGIQYEYKVPCGQCLSGGVMKPTMFSSKTLRRAVHQKALFLQCNKQFHVLSISEVQCTLLPQTAADYDLQLQRDVFDLGSINNQLMHDVFLLYCAANLPSVEQETQFVSPRKLSEDLTKVGYSCWFADDISKRRVEEVATAIQNSKIVLVMMSNEFVADYPSQRLLQFVKNNSKVIIPIAVGVGREWRQSSIVADLSDKVYVNMEKIEFYEERFEQLQEQISNVSKEKAAPKSVFVSYCWYNSASAVAIGQARPKDNSVGIEDPRELKQFFEDQGLSCWIDIEQVGRMGLFEDIAEGMRNCKVVIACISDEYVKSDNCKMEFRFAHIMLKKPIIIVVVGNGFGWESTEIGMLSLSYPKFNFQSTSGDVNRQLLLNKVQELIDKVTDETAASPLAGLDHLQKEKAFKELHEVVQRKFLRQLVSYVEDLEAYPHLFVFDFYQSSSEEDLDDEVSVKKVLDNADGQTSPIENSIEDIYQKPICVKTLCEYEAGWHCVDDGVPVDAGLIEGSAASLWELTAPYMARVLSVMKHCNVELKLLKSIDGDKVIKALQANAGPDTLPRVRNVYLSLRKYVRLKDRKSSCGSLRRCYMPNGKNLWLCRQHQSLPQVNVLPVSESTEAEVDEASSSSLELGLLQSLRLAASEFIPAQNEEEPRWRKPEGSSKLKKSPQQTRASSPRPTAVATDSLVPNWEASSSIEKTSKRRQSQTPAVSVPARQVSTSQKPPKPIKTDPLGVGGRRNEQPIDKLTISALLAQGDFQPFDEKTSKACSIL